MLDIKELILNIPEIGYAEGELLALEVAQILSDRLDDRHTTRHIDHIKIRMDFPSGQIRNRLADRIAEAIWKELKQHMVK